VPTSPADLESFIARWDGTAMAERANYIPFLSELCDLLDVPRPDAATGSGGPYRFERSVTHHEADGSTSPRRIDLYRRGCFVWEAKQGATPHRQAALFAPDSEAQHRANVRNTPAWVRYMQKAKGQAEGYARDLPASEGWPPFLVVCDVGFCIDLYADFSGTGKHYAQFPDRERFRIYMTDLRDSKIRDRLRAVWVEPNNLNPALHRAQVTRNIAALLANLAAALEGSPAKPRHDPGLVATFLMRCIFCMFAQSVGLLPKRTSFSDLLRRCEANPANFVDELAELWRAMDGGHYCGSLGARVLRFNGGLFRAGPDRDVAPLPVEANELALLILAAGKDWADVEPAIFGTLLENALATKERGRLGAEFTPRPFVERLVLPTVMEPIREDWDGVRAAAEAAMEAGNAPAAAALVRGFHAALCAVRVLDPACGTGNFLYVTLELMKRLEGEVLDALAGYARGDAGLLDLAGATVDPHQFLGLDLNPRAVPVAELVLWIGYLQWHFRTNGTAPPAPPILRDFKTIRQADALLSYTRTEGERDSKGNPVTRWGGRTKLHPITGEQVPDEANRVLVLRPVGGKPAPWPEADFIVGNPPFVAGKDMREELGGGYAGALWAAYPKVPPSADLALFFWWRAAQLTAARKVRRFGFIASNSIRQEFCRRVVAAALDGRKPLHLVFAIPDHPWSQGVGSAAVRIAMTVAAPGVGPGKLLTVMHEGAGDVPEVVLTETLGVVNADLTVGVSPATARALRANERLCSPGVKLHGAGFIVTPATARALGLGTVPGLDAHIRPYLNGKDTTGRSRGVMVLDLFGLAADEVRERFPEAFQHLLLNVKPERDAKREDSPDSAAYGRLWWLHGKPRPELRVALHGLPRYIVTVETAKHRTFVFQPAAVLPDNKLICIATDAAWHLGVLSSGLHVRWALKAGGLLENRPVYVKSRCFDPFPFPAATPAQQAAIAHPAEALDRHRAARLAARPYLTLTGLYNVLDALRAGRALTDAERDVLDAGQVATLQHLHDELDAAVADAYGWPVNLPATEVVARVVALNRARLAEEAAGQVRWLRPDYQAPAEQRRIAAQNAEQAALDVYVNAALPAWPKGVPAQYVALRAALTGGAPSAPADLARRFRGAHRAKLAPMLAVLAAMGQARDAGGGRYVA
jgi:hypothetical protein